MTQISRKVTAENWRDAERDMKESGIRSTVHDKDGFLQKVVTKKEVEYEFSREVLNELVASGLVRLRLGRKAE